MTVTYGFYNSVDGDRVYSAEEFSSLFDGILNDGIFDTIGDVFAVSEQTGLNMNIIIGSGRCWFNRTWLNNSANLTKTIADANPVLDRIDTVIIEIDTSSGVRANSIKVLTGTPDASPVPPTLADTATLHQYRLADVYVAAAVTAITDADITSFIGTVNTPYAYLMDSKLIGDGTDYFLDTQGIIADGELVRYNSDDNNLVPAGKTVSQLGDVTTQSEPVVDERIVVYNGTSGNSIKDSGYTIATLLASGGGGGGGKDFIDQSGGTGDAFGALGGTINGTNKVFTVSKGAYISGAIRVYLNGQLQTQGSGEDYVETTPSSGTFTFAVAPVIGDEITVVYNSTESYILQPNRNFIVDGAMQIAQSGTSETGITASKYPKAVDLWRIFLTTLGTWSVSQDTANAPKIKGFSRAYKLLNTVAKASPVTSDNLILSTVMPGNLFQSVRKGTSEAKPLTLSFLVRSSKTGTFIVEIQDLDNNLHICKAVTINLANTWESKVITFPAETTGVIDDNHEASIQLNFWLGAGSNFTSGTLATSWATKVNANRAVGCSNWADTVGNDFYITGVQLETGEDATEFDHKSFARSLAEVQVYLNTNCPYGTTPADGAASNVFRSVATALTTTSLSCARLDFPVNMVAAPTITYYRSSLGSAAGLGCYYNGSSWQNMAAMSQVVDTKGLIVNGTAGAVFTQFDSYIFDVIWVADARL